MLSILPAPAHGQSIRCILPLQAVASSKPCEIRAASKERGTERLILRLIDSSGAGVAGEVKVDATAGSVPSTVQTGPDGLFHVPWTGTADEDVRVTFLYEGAGSRTRRPVIIKPPEEPTPTARAVSLSEKESGDKQYWFSGLELRKPLRVRIANVSDSACAVTPVAFIPRSAGVKAAPDSAYGVVQKNGTCVAETRLSLEKKVRHHYVVARTRGQQDGVTFEAYSRQLPRIFLGVHFGYGREWTGLSSDTESFTVTTTDPETGAVTTRTVTEKTPTLEENRADWGFDPVVGVDVPLWYTIPNLRLSAGADMGDFRSQWFTGISILQPFMGFSQEGLGMDVHLSVNFARRDRVSNLGECSATPDTCATEKNTRVAGVGLMLVTDGAGLVSKMISALTGG